MAKTARSDGSANQQGPRRVSYAFGRDEPLKPPLIPRPEQVDAIKALFAAWDAGENNLLIEMATGTGKALVIAEVVVAALRRWPDTRILVLTDTIEILKQDVEHLIRQAPDLADRVGINAASLKRRDWTQQVIIGQVQSVHRRADRLGKRHFVIVDEAHRIPVHRYSMFRKTFGAVGAGEVCGVTATAFRLDSGTLTQGKNALFSRIVYTFGYREALLAGRVVPIVSKRAVDSIDTSNVHVRHGEFIKADLEAAATKGGLVERACAEIVRCCENRRTVLVFCVSISHAADVAAVLQKFGETVAVVTGCTSPQERERLIELFKNGEIRFLVNVGVLTTGSNIPPVDAIAVLRATMSTGLWIQICGRGTRKSPGKEDCLLLDFGGNIRRHGPIDMASHKFDPSRLKDCPICRAVAPTGADTCKACGFIWPKREIVGQLGPRTPTHDWKADDAPAQVTTYVPEWVTVMRVKVQKHYKHNEPNAPPSLRIDYVCGRRVYAEWVSLERRGFSRTMAIRWWFAMGGRAPVPDTVAEALARFDEIKTVTEILPVPEGKYWKIAGRKLPDGTIVNRDCHRCTPAQHGASPVNDDRGVSSGS